jgi:hypothetical protein
MARQDVHHNAPHQYDLGKMGNSFEGACVSRYRDSPKPTINADSLSKNGDYEPNSIRIISLKESLHAGNLVLMVSAIRSQVTP